MKYPGYFLIVADFIQWAKAKGIPVGPGRGSGAGSLVSYALTITDLDPIRFGLLFERFLNPERVSMPDFDIDFCQDRRDEVIRYVQERYGRDQVAQIITFGTLQARGVLRDVGRVLQMPYGQVDKLCKLVPQNPAEPGDAGAGDRRRAEAAGRARQRSGGQARLRHRPEARRALPPRLDARRRHRHRRPRRSTELVPLYRDPKSDMPVTQFNMKWVEQAGLVKFDFLGLKTLTVLADRGRRWCAGAASRSISPRSRSTTRRPTTCWRAAEAVGVFQLESAGMRRALLDMRPDRFEDIIALVALYRPGPMANIPTYCARKHGMEQPDYIHPKLEPILKETFGVIIYQEQVMQAAQILAGYSLGAGRSAAPRHGQEDQEGDAGAARAISSHGAVERGIERYQADAIFDLLERFAEYGFNKSHAAAYALVAYQTAYMKANYPVEFLAASMTLDMGNTDKLAEFRAEAERLGIRVDPPSINRSQRRHSRSKATPSSMRSPRSKASASRRWRRSSPRAAASKFADLADFAARINPRAVNKRVLESLTAAGAFDEFEPNRARVLPGHGRRARRAPSARMRPPRSGRANCSAAAAGSASRSRCRRSSHGCRPSGCGANTRRSDSSSPAIRSTITPPCSKKLRVQSWAEFSRAVKNGATAGRVAGTVVARQERRTRTGSKMGIIGLSDPTGHYEAVIFAEGLAEHRDLLEPGTAVLLFLSAEVQGDEVRARIQSAEPLDAAAANLQQGPARVPARREADRGGGQAPRASARRARQMATAR